MKLLLINGMSRMIRPAWFFAPTLVEYIATRRDQVGGFYYKDEVARGMLEGFPIYTSQQIPTNLGTGNGSEFYLVDMADTVIADTLNVMVDASDVAAYYGTDGKIVSTFQRDQSLFRVISEHDFNMRHLQSLAVGTTSDWMFSGLPGVPGAPFVRRVRRPRRRRLRPMRVERLRRLCRDPHHQSGWRTLSAAGHELSGWSAGWPRGQRWPAAATCRRQRPARRALRTAVIAQP
jgi:hypothetical protein